jgi:hypothetical protein
MHPASGISARDPRTSGTSFDIDSVPIVMILAAQYCACFSSQPRLSSMGWNAYSSRMPMNTDSPT